MVFSKSLEVAYGKGSIKPSSLSLFWAKRLRHFAPASIKHGVVSNFEGLQWPMGKGQKKIQISDLLHSEDLLDRLHVGTLRAQKYINKQVDQSQLLRYVLQLC